MRKRIILMTVLFACIPLLLMGYKAYQYYDYQGNSYDKNMKFQDDMEKINADLMERNNDLEQMKYSNDEKIGILELWKKRLEKIKN